MKNRHQRNKEKNHQAHLHIQNKKLFLAGLKKYCNDLAGFDLYSKFPAELIESIYDFRISGIKLMRAEGSRLSAAEVSECERVLKQFAREATVELPDGKGEITLEFQITVGASLFINILYSQRAGLFPNEMAEIKSAIPEFTEDSPYFERYIKKLHEVLMVVGLSQTRLNNGFIWLKTEVAVLNKKLKNCFYMHRIEPVKIHFTIDGNTRPAFRVGWAFPHNIFQWVAIKPSQLGMDTTEGDQEMEVYVQLHALARLEERVGRNTGMMHFALYWAISQPLYHIDEDGKIFIHYYYHRHKIGYLVCSVNDRKLLIHTFLFLTNSGTPEGKKLSKLTGLKAMDKKYLAIDKLSTLLAYNINDNEFVKNIFEQAGCGSLWNLPSEEDDSIPANASVNFIQNYLTAHMSMDEIKKHFRIQV